MYNLDNYYSFISIVIINKVERDSRKIAIIVRVLTILFKDYITKKQLFSIANF